MAFIDRLAALCLNRRDLANGQRHRRPAIWAGKSAETTYANVRRRQYRPAPRRRRAQPFRGPRGHRQRVRFAAALRRLRQSRKGARATSGPRAAPARFSSGAAAVMPKQQADIHSALAAVARRTRGTDVIELKRVAACYDCQSSLPIEASMRVTWMLRRRQLRNSSTSIPRYWHRGVGVLLLFYYEKRRDARALPTHPIPAAPRFKTKI